MKWCCGRIALEAPPTSAFVSNSKELYKEGFILSLELEDGSVGYGEVGIDLMLYHLLYWFVISLSS